MHVTESRWWVVMTILIPVLLLLGGCYGTIHVKEEAPRESERLEQVAVERGRSIYELNCQSCHGLEGHGDGPEADRFNAPLPDLSKPGLHITTTGLESIVDYPHYSPQAMQQRIRHGTDTMPEFRYDFTAQEISDIVAFLQHLTLQSVPQSE